MARGDEGIFARRLRPRAFARRITKRHPDRGCLQAILASAHLAGCPIEAIDPIEIGFRRREKFIVPRHGASRGRQHGQSGKEAKLLARREERQKPHYPSSQTHPKRDSQIATIIRESSIAREGQEVPEGANTVQGA
jgi:hypothetical protein